jgi:hypothetical protein
LQSGSVYLKWNILSDNFYGTLHLLLDGVAEEDEDKVYKKLRAAAMVELRTAAKEVLEFLKAHKFTEFHKNKMRGRQEDGFWARRKRGEI